MIGGTERLLEARRAVPADRQVSGIDHAWPKTAEKSSTSLKLPLHRSDRAARGDQPGFSNLHGFFESSPE